MYKHKVVHVLLLLTLLANAMGFMPAQAEDVVLPAPGTMVNLSPAFNPPVLKGLKVHTDNPFKFDFVLSTGDAGLDKTPPKGVSLKEESTKLIKYFLASLTVPEKDLWVNLSPYEKDRIVPEGFGKTEMGRDLLAQDYVLKQITASLIYPEGETGREFWKKVYEQAAEKFGTRDVPVNTFNKVWIMPDKAVVFENSQTGTAYVVESTLKVMLEEDYLAVEKNAKAPQGNPGSTLAQDIIREIVIPQLTKEINEGKNFVQLRQVYNSLILATWFKKKIKDSILSQVYNDKNKFAGIVSLQGAEGPEAIYQKYLEAFKKGAYNYIKEETDPASGQVIARKYFSGGAKFNLSESRNLQIFDQNTASPAMLSRLDKEPDPAVVAAQLDVAQTPQTRKGADMAMTSDNWLENGRLQKQFGPLVNTILVDQNKIVSHEGQPAINLLSWTHQESGAFAEEFIRRLQEQHPQAAVSDFQTLLRFYLTAEHLIDFSFQDPQGQMYVYVDHLIAVIQRIHTVSANLKVSGWSPSIVTNETAGVLVYLKNVLSDAFLLDVLETAGLHGTRWENVNADPGVEREIESNYRGARDRWLGGKSKYYPELKAILNKFAGLDIGTHLRYVLLNTLTANELIQELPEVQADYRDAIAEAFKENIKGPIASLLLEAQGLKTDPQGAITITGFLPSYHRQGLIIKGESAQGTEVIKLNEGAEQIAIEPYIEGTPLIDWIEKEWRTSTAAEIRAAVENYVGIQMELLMDGKVSNWLYPTGIVVDAEGIAHLVDRDNVLSYAQADPVAVKRNFILNTVRLLIGHEFQDMNEDQWRIAQQELARMPWGKDRQIVSIADFLRRSFNNDRQDFMDFVQILAGEFFPPVGVAEAGNVQEGFKEALEGVVTADEQNNLLALSDERWTQIASAFIDAVRRENGWRLFNGDAEKFIRFYLTSEQMRDYEGKHKHLNMQDLLGILYFLHSASVDRHQEGWRSESIMPETPSLTSFMNLRIFDYQLYKMVLDDPGVAQAHKVFFDAYDIDYAEQYKIAFINLHVQNIRKMQAQGTLDYFTAEGRRQAEQEMVEYLKEIISKDADYVRAAQRSPQLAGLTLEKMIYRHWDHFVFAAKNQSGQPKIVKIYITDSEEDAQGATNNLRSFLGLPGAQAPALAVVRPASTPDLLFSSARPAARNPLDDIIGRAIGQPQARPAPSVLGNTLSTPRAAVVPSAPTRHNINRPGVRIEKAAADGTFIILVGEPEGQNVFEMITKPQGMVSVRQRLRWAQAYVQLNINPVMFTPPRSGYPGRVNRDLSPDHRRNWFKPANIVFGENGQIILSDYMDRTSYIPKNGRAYKQAMLKILVRIIFGADMDLSDRDTWTALRKYAQSDAEEGDLPMLLELIKFMETSFSNNLSLMEFYPAWANVWKEMDSHMSKQDEQPAVEAEQPAAAAQAPAAQPVREAVAAPVQEPARPAPAPAVNDFPEGTVFQDWLNRPKITAKQVLAQLKAYVQLQNDILNTGSVDATLDPKDITAGSAGRMILTRRGRVSHYDPQQAQEVRQEFIRSILYVLTGQRFAAMDNEAWQTAQAHLSEKGWDAEPKVMEVFVFLRHSYEFQGQTMMEFLDRFFSLYFDPAAAGRAENEFEQILNSVITEEEGKDLSKFSNEQWGEVRSILLDETRGKYGRAVINGDVESVFEIFFTAEKMAQFAEAYGHLNLADLVLIAQHLHSLGLEMKRWGIREESLQPLNLADVLKQAQFSYAFYLKVLEKLGWADPELDNAQPDHDLKFQAAAIRLNNVSHRKALIELYNFNPPLQALQSFKEILMTEVERKKYDVFKTGGVDAVLEEDMVKYLTNNTETDINVIAGAFEYYRDYTFERVWFRGLDHIELLAVKGGQKKVLRLSLVGERKLAEEYGQQQTRLAKVTNLPISQVTADARGLFNRIVGIGGNRYYIFEINSFIDGQNFLDFLARTVSVDDLPVRLGLADKFVDLNQRLNASKFVNRDLDPLLRTSVRSMANIILDHSGRMVLFDLRHVISKHPSKTKAKQYTTRLVRALLYVIFGQQFVNDLNPQEWNYLKYLAQTHFQAHEQDVLSIIEFLENAVNSNMDIDTFYTEWAKHMPGKMARLSADQAMPSKTRREGGIDFKADGVSLEIQNAGKALEFKADPAMLQRFQNAAGFRPRILSIQPTVDLKQFLGLP